jgi:phosphoenolpyruvate synthase/pyruvate phosphate dikinase
MDRLIVGLNALNDPDFDRELVGAKALHLNQLHQAGLPVPQGFVITTEAYQAYVAANGLNEQIGNAQRVGTARGLEKHFLRGIERLELRGSAIVGH